MKRLMLTFFLVLSAACGDTTTTDPGPDTNNPQPQPLGLCSASNPCPTGQFCFNGLCAPGCNTNTECAADQYCDTKDLGPPFYCKNKTVPSCTSDSQCAASQVCLQGLCSMKPPEVKPACDPDKAGTAEDGCDKYAICNDPAPDNSSKQDAYCASFPPCPESGVCPTGMAGAVCNEGYLSGKGRFCMEGLCKDNTHCPTSWSCVKLFSNMVLGLCSSGAMGSPCTSNTQCTSGNCMASPGAPGVCM